MTATINGYLCEACDDFHSVEDGGPYRREYMGVVMQVCRNHATEIVVYGCFGCGGEELPERTHTMMYHDTVADTWEMHWLCRPCLRRFSDMGPLKVRDGLTEADKHPDAQAEFFGGSPIRERIASVS